MEEDKLSAIFKKNPVYVSAHNDADGVTSAVLLSYAFPAKVSFPKTFGEADSSIDIIVDQVPKDPTFPNIVFDHHPGHPDENNRGYTLVWDTVPASLIVYRFVKNKIPKHMLWKVVVGICGDGQPELIPSEVWDACPELCNEIVSSRRGRYGKYVGSRPVWDCLSAPINYSCRLAKSGPELAYNLLRSYMSPMDVIREPAFQTCREAILKEVEAVAEGLDLIDCGKVIFGEIRSENKIENLIAYRYVKKSKVVVMVNSQSKSISIRGIYTKWLLDKLQPKGWELGGHAGFAGGSLGTRTGKELLADIMKACRETGITNA
jgi:hypothetical protein